MLTRVFSWLFALWMLGLFCASAQLSAATGWNVVEAGAVGDGVADCTAAFQKCLDAAGKAGGTAGNKRASQKPHPAR